MKATAKYLFDEDFATGEKPTITLVEAERRRADAESKAYRNGFAAGQAQAQNEAAQRIAAALALIADGMDAPRARRSPTSRRGWKPRRCEVAVAVAGKLAPELIAREPFAEISALATECFQHLVKTPHVVVRIGAEILRDGQGQARGDRRRARLRGPPGGAVRPTHWRAGDCRIEWADGGVARDRAATVAIIDDVVARYVAARKGTTN